jgi:hypothetical protein
MSKDYLTGRYYFKQTIFGLVLMVEYEYPDASPGFFYLKWRKAKPKDILNIDFSKNMGI